MKFLHIACAVALLTPAGGVALAQMSHGSGQGAAAAGDHKAGVAVTQGWARATAKLARSGAAYVTLDNTGDTPDKLVSASTPVAKKAELHTHIKDGAVMKMRAVQSIEVGPHAKVTLKPGGLHLMLMGLKAPLEKGSTFPLTLTFEKAGKKTVKVRVEGIAAMSPDGGHEMPGGMKH